MCEWEKWRGECANGMYERCEANLLIASVRPAVGRAVFIIREHAIFWKKAISFPSYTISSTPWAFPFCAGGHPPWGWSGLSFSFFDPHGLPLFFADPLDITI